MSTVSTRRPLHCALLSARRALVLAPLLLQLALAAGPASVQGAEAPARATGSGAAAAPPLDAGVPYRATVVRIPMRDGIELAGNLVTPRAGRPAPVVVSITPYDRHALHVVGATMAPVGLAFLAAYVRGRGDSAGEFQVFRGDLDDTVDVLAWAGRQPFSNGRSAMWGPPTAASTSGWPQRAERLASRR